MTGMIGLARRGVIASARSRGVVASYASFPSKPAGIVDVAMTVGAGASTVNSNVFTEGNSTATGGSYFSAAVFPDEMGTSLYAPRVRNANRAVSDRGIGCGMANSAGTSIVYFIMCGNSTAASIQTWVGGTRAIQTSQSGLFSTSSSDWLSLVPTLESGHYRYTVHKNASATALSWLDSADLIGVPGKHPCVTFRHSYSGGQFPSQGVAAFSAADI